MNRNTLWLALAFSPLCLLASSSAMAANNGTDANTIKCKMAFTLSGWSAVYQTADGVGTVTCNNGKSMKVELSAKGGGLSVGKYQLDKGKGKFTGVKNINDVLGTYATASAHAGVVGSSRAAAMTKGDVSLALSGTGHGWNIGAGFSGFTIKQAH